MTAEAAKPEVVRSADVEKIKRSHAGGCFRNSWSCRAQAASGDLMTRTDTAPDGHRRAFGLPVWMLGVAAVGSSTLLVLSCVLVFPRWLSPPPSGADLKGLTHKERLDVLRDQRKLENDTRAGLLGGLAGLGVLIGSTIAWQQLRHNRRQLSATIEQGQQQLEHSRIGQINDRFTRAIDQLGDDRSEIALGGIYGLERIARDAPDQYQTTIAEVLTAYVRSHAQPRSSKADSNATATKFDISPRLEMRAPAVQAALNVLGRGGFAKVLELDLSNTDLQRANLTDANLQRVLLIGTNLEGATLTRTNLEHAHLEGSVLRKARLYEANLERALLYDADLQKAALPGANLRVAILQRVNLSEASLIGANLQSAFLPEADLQRSELMHANLQGAMLKLANLSNAYLQSANLQGANLQEVKLAEAFLYGVDFQGASLEAADLRYTRLASAKLGDTNLAQANLEGADLENADLDGAVADSTTIWPRGFDYESAGVTVFEDLGKCITAFMRKSLDRIEAAEATGQSNSSAATVPPPEQPDAGSP